MAQTVHPSSSWSGHLPFMSQIIGNEVKTIGGYTLIKVAMIHGLIFLHF